MGENPFRVKGNEVHWSPELWWIPYNKELWAQFCEDDPEFAERWAREKHEHGRVGEDVDSQEAD
jgi:hypothetical protein